MARRQSGSSLNVYFNGRLIGHFRRERTAAVNFQYDPDWLSWENAIPVSLSMPLREDRYVGETVMAVFDNLLPDNADILRRLAERTGASGIDAFSLLTAIGRDCVGALQFFPPGHEAGPAGAIADAACEAWNRMASETGRLTSLSS